MKIIGIIPARYASTRFPAKSLAIIKGKSMIQRVYEQAQQSSALNTIIVATDHQEIYRPRQKIWRSRMHDKTRSRQRNRQML